MPPFRSKSKSRSQRDKSRGHGKRPHKKRSRGLKQYDAEGNVVRARVTYGGLSDDPNDWSPKHRTRQKKINYTEMPNTESEDVSCYYTFFFQKGAEVDRRDGGTTWLRINWGGGSMP